ncbi:hypothetical protein [Maioricimonas sp. JC845]|uniref:tetratricopeptide repeat protein n=1 Tax=Maioricimonas sp. JC845 TaxID=3232138 RepID=UPI00345826D5
MNMLTLGSLLDRYANEKEAAADVFADAGALLEREGGLVSGLPDGVDLERFAAEEMMLRHALGDDGRALECFRTLASLPSPRRSPNEYFRESIARLLAQQPDSACAEFIRTWLPRLPDDGDKLLVLFELARCYTRSGDDSEALEVYEVLYRNHFQELCSVDRSLSGAEFSRGTTASSVVLERVFNGWLSSNRTDEAHEVGELYVEVFPEGQYAEEIQRTLEGLKRLEASTLNASPEKHSSIPLIVALNVVWIVLLGAVGVWRRKRRRSTSPTP